MTVGELPASLFRRPLPPGGVRRSTMAMGEEGGRMTTMAMGEEGGPRPPVRRGGDMTGGIGEDIGRGKPDVTSRPAVRLGGR